MTAAGAGEAARPGEEVNVVLLPNGLRVRVIERVDVHVDPGRDLHGPCVVRAANGDLLLCHQDANHHLGGDGFTHQWRSRDNGFTWRDEGPAADWRARSIDALFGEYGLVPGGRLVMIVQRRHVQAGNTGIVASWLQVSDDHGHSWREIGPVDGSDEYAVMSARNILAHDGLMLTGIWSRLGSALYVSRDRGLSWHKRSVIFPADYPDFATLRDAGPPFYPHVVLCPDGSLLAMTYYTPPVGCCYTRRSTDLGETWGPIAKEPALPLWAPRMKRSNDETLIVTGRDIAEKATVAWFSTDSGRTWDNKLVLDKPRYLGSYAYTDSIGAGIGRFWVFTSSPQSEGKGDIIGVLLELAPPDTQ